jgi:hypothetical protein
MRDESLGAADVEDRLAFDLFEQRSEADQLRLQEAVAGSVVRMEPALLTH